MMFPEIGDGIPDLGSQKIAKTEFDTSVGCWNINLDLGPIDL